MSTHMSGSILSRRERLTARIHSIRVHSDHAAVIVVLGGSTRTRLRFANEDGEWKLDTVFGNSAPPAADL
jgi:hypothetical protein